MGNYAEMPAASRNMLSSAIVSSTGSQRRLTYGTIPSKPTDFDTWNIILYNMSNICLRFEVKNIEYDWDIDIAKEQQTGKPSMKAQGALLVCFWLPARRA